MPVTNHMVCSCHLKTRTPSKENIKVIKIKLITKTIPRARSGTFYNTV
jgi:hypothetical protein